MTNVNEAFIHFFSLEEETNFYHLQSCSFWKLDRNKRILIEQRIHVTDCKVCTSRKRSNFADESRVPELIGGRLSKTARGA
jgi:hypothetical protein